MKALFYFSRSDLMIRVQYSHQAHAFRYFSHRKITEGERAIIEKYITENIASETKNARYSTASLDYSGVDFKLINHLHQFHAIKPFKSTEERQQEHLGNPFKNLIDKDVEKSVQELIYKSMSNYYFEKIGNTILRVRKNVEQGATAEQLRSYKKDLEELVKAYNQYSEKKATLKEVLPKELNS